MKKKVKIKVSCKSHTSVRPTRQGVSGGAERTLQAHAVTRVAFGLKAGRTKKVGKGRRTGCSGGEPALPQHAADVDGALRGRETGEHPKKLCVLNEARPGTRPTASFAPRTRRVTAAQRRALLAPAASGWCPGCRARLWARRNTRCAY